MARSPSTSPGVAGELELGPQSTQQVRSQSSRWIAPLAPTAGKSKTIYGGPKGFFKDVFAFRKSRSASQSAQGTEGMWTPLLPGSLSLNDLYTRSITST